MFRVKSVRTQNNGNAALLSAAQTCKRCLMTERMCPLAIDLKKSLELPTLEDQKYQINTPIAALSAAQILWTSSIVASMSAAASQPLNFILWHCSGSEPQFKDQCQGFKIFDAVFQPCVFWLRHFLFAVWTLSGEARRNVLVFVLIAPSGARIRTTRVEPSTINSSMFPDVWISTISRRYLHWRRGCSCRSCCPSDCS